MFKIAICGCGVVGSGVADILMEQQEKLSARFGTEVRLGYILDIRDLSGTPYAPYAVADLETVLADADVRLVTITIGGLDLAYRFCRAALESGRHVVTSNKEVVAAHMQDLEQLAFERHVRFLYEASAGGGIPIIRPLNICLSANRITEIEGILNGTTNYILTGMYRDRLSFDEVLQDAQRKGFAEANPAADVDGYDAARKIAILSSIAYGRFVDYNDVACTGIREIRYLDHELAAAAGYSIKLLAGSRLLDDGTIRISVEPKLVPQSHILSSVRSVYNAVLTKSSYAGDSLFYGQGAGKLATASAVVGDMIEILGRPEAATLPSFVRDKAEIDADGDGRYRFYLRMRTHFPDDRDLDELATVVQGIFGSAVNYIGCSMTQDDTVAFITDYCTRTELTALIVELEDTADVCVEYSMKVLD